MYYFKYILNLAPDHTGKQNPTPFYNLPAKLNGMS